jgi:alkylation response protein AidB-like acyl-CoA dehydrogenase
MSLTVEERDELRSAARGLLTRESSVERVRATIAEPPGFDRGLWDAMVALGWPAIHVSSARGGAGCGYADLAVVLHELGRALTPSPFLASAVLATGALSSADNTDVADQLLPRLAAGEALASVAFASTDGSYEPARLTTTWTPAGASLRLAGASGFVLDADIADVLVVAACDGEGMVAVIAVDATAHGIHVERVATVDETRRVFVVSFDDVEAPTDRMLTEPGDRAADLLARVLAIGTIAAACDATGTAERALEQAAEYARERVQFGKPIGSFQAVKHLCADMAIAVEASRSATTAAVAALDGDPAAWTTTAAITSSYVGPACANACALGLRVHGGIGFTWEHESHLFLKRVKLDEVLFGSPSWQRQRLADAVFPALVSS